MKKLFPLAVSLGLWACGDSSPTPTDAGTDAGLVDTGAAPDASVPDVGPSDSGVVDDTGVPDGGTDAGRPDSGAPDVGSTDTGVPDSGPGCARASDYVGDPSWPNVVGVTAEATYCGTFNEARDLRQEAAFKAKLHLIEGVYSFPDDALTHDFVLPACVELIGTSPVTGTSTGSLEQNHQPGRLIYHWTRPYPTNPGPRTLDSTLWITTSSMTLDGGAFDPFGGNYFDFVLCPINGECYASDAIRFDSCHYEGTPSEFNRITLSDGNIELETRLAESAAGTEPGAFIAARGMFRGVAFEQLDYFKLIYNPTHHHFTRSFAVLFGTPIGGVCGLELSDIETFGGLGQGEEAYAIDCDLNRIETLQITNSTWERP